MTHLEMLEKIWEHNEPDIISYEKVDKLGWRLYSTGPEDECATAISKYSPTLPKAIEAAYKKLFPPIPESVGEGEEEWAWAQGGVKCWETRRGTRAHIDKSTRRTGGYFFAVDGDRWNAAIHDITKEEMRGFLKLIEINPELKPPTEEGESDAEKTS